MKIPWISDIYVKTCWSPCYWHPNVRSGSYAVAVYTIAMSIIIITYLIGEFYTEIEGDGAYGDVLKGLSVELDQYYINIDIRIRIFYLNISEYWSIKFTGNAGIKTVFFFIFKDNIIKKFDNFILVKLPINITHALI